MERDKPACSLPFHRSGAAVMSTLRETEPLPWEARHARFDFSVRHGYEHRPSIALASWADGMPMTMVTRSRNKAVLERIMQEHVAAFRPPACKSASPLFFPEEFRAQTLRREHAQAAPSCHADLAMSRASASPGLFPNRELQIA